MRHDTYTHKKRLCWRPLVLLKRMHIQNESETRDQGEPTPCNNRSDTRSSRSAVTSTVFKVDTRLEADMSV